MRNSLSIFSQGWRKLLPALMLAASLAACGAGTVEPIAPPSLPVEPTAAVELSVIGGGSVQSEPAGLSCSADCSVPFPRGSTVTLTATPLAGQIFAGWSGSCSGSGSCVVVMDQVRSVAAGFISDSTPRNFNLNVALSGSGSVTSLPAGINCGSSCSSAFLAGTQVTLTPTPAANQSFAGWSGACTGASACVVTVNSISNVTATFTPITANQFTLVTSVTGSGRITSSPAGIDCGADCSELYAAGTAVTLTAMPAAGQVFSGWGGDCSGAQLTCVLNVSQSRSARAAFVVAPPAAAVWQAAQLLETSNDFNVAGDNTFASVNALTAVGANGHALVIWEQSDGTPDGNTVKALSRRYDPTNGWAATVAVPGLSASGFGLIDGYLFMDSAGVATWIRQNRETRRSTLTAGWGAVFSVPLVNPGGIQPGQLASGVIDNNGNIGMMLSGSDVYNIALAAGSQQWGTWARVDASGALGAVSARVALSSNGTAIAAWAEGNPGDNFYSMKAARFTPADGWTAPVALEGLFTDVQRTSLSVAMDAQGNGIVMWAQGNSIYYNLYRTGSGWQGAVEVDAGQAGGISSPQPQVVMTPDGRAVAIWRIGLAVQRSMQYSPVTGWTAPVTLASYALEAQLYITDAGQATVVYIPAINPTTAQFDLVSQSLSFGSAWSTPILLETAAGNVKSKSFSMNRSGQGVAVWAQNDIANSQVRNSLWSATLR